MSSGIAISDAFFKNHLGGDISRLTPLYLKSANGATDNATMTTLGEVSIQLRFSRINMIFGKFISAYYIRGKFS